MVMALPDARRKYPEMAALWDEHQITFRDKQWGPDNPIRKREYRAIWARDNTTNIFQYRARLEDGTIWNEWDPEFEERGPDRVAIAKLPMGANGKPREDWLFAFAMDLGSKDPFALNVFAASPSDQSRTIYHVYGFERPGMYPHKIAILLLGPRVVTNLDAAHREPGGVIGAVGSWPAGMVCDIKQLGTDYLKELSEIYGISVLPAEQTGKMAGIELVNGDLTEGPRLKILKGSTLASQLEQLQWVKDEYGFPREDKGQANHSSDTLIYGRRELARLFEQADDGTSEKKDRRESRSDPRGSGLAELLRPKSEFDGLFGDDYSRFGT
jgi:hypothetical protein